MSTHVPSPANTPGSARGAACARRGASTRAATMRQVRGGAPTSVRATCEGTVKDAYSRLRGGGTPAGARERSPRRERAGPVPVIYAARGCSSVGRASASQAVGRGFESLRPLRKGPQMRAFWFLGVPRRSKRVRFVSGASDGYRGELSGDQVRSCSPHASPRPLESPGSGPHQAREGSRVRAACVLPGVLAAGAWGRRWQRSCSPPPKVP